MAAKEVQGDRAGGDSKLLRVLTGKYDNVENFEFPLSITLGGSKMGGLPHFSGWLLQSVHGSDSRTRTQVLRIRLRCAGRENGERPMLIYID